MDTHSTPLLSVQDVYPDLRHELSQSSQLYQAPPLLSTQSPSAPPPPFHLPSCCLPAHSFLRPASPQDTVRQLLNQLRLFSFTKLG